MIAIVFKKNPSTWHAALVEKINSRTDAQQC